MANEGINEQAELDQSPGLVRRWRTWVEERPWINSILTLLLLLLVAVILAFVVAVFLWALNPNDAPAWTGFGSASHPLYTGISPQKTLWDWLGMLIIPMFLGLIAAMLGRAQQNRAIRQHEMERGLADEARAHDWQIEKDRQEQDRIDGYFKHMSALMLVHELRASGPEDDIRKIARASTLSILRSVNAERRGMVLLFLYEAQLINTPDPIINLRGAQLEDVDLETADLRGAHLAETELSGAHLDRAQLAGTNLNQANLINAELRRADLSESNLAGAYLSGTHMREADLSQADLSDVLLNNAIAIGANLCGTKLRLSNLVNADFSRTQLQGADLGEAKCKPANADTEEQSLVVTGAVYDEETIWPEDFDPAEHGAKEVNDQ